MEKWRSAEAAEGWDKGVKQTEKKEAGAQVCVAREEGKREEGESGKGKRRASGTQRKGERKAHQQM